MKSFIILDSNIWLMLFSKNTIVVKRIKGILEDESNFVITNDIIKMEILRNCIKVSDQNKISETERIDIIKYINNYFSNGNNRVYYYEKIKDISEEYIQKIENRKFLKCPPYFSFDSDKKLNNNDSVIWCSLLDFLKGVADQHKVIFYSNDLDFIKSKEWLSLELKNYDNKCESVIFESIELFNYYKNELSYRGLDFEVCISIFKNLSFILNNARDEIPIEFIKWLLDDNYRYKDGQYHDQLTHPTGYLIYDTRHDPEETVSNFYFELFLYFYSSDFASKCKKTKKHKSLQQDKIIEKHKKEFFSRKVVVNKK